MASRFVQNMVEKISFRPKREINSQASTRMSDFAKFNLIRCLHINRSNVICTQFLLERKYQVSIKTIFVF